MRLWCGKCVRGIDGLLNGQCPECVSRGETQPGILKTPEQATIDKLEQAKAKRLLLAKSQVKPYKSMDDVKREAKEEAIADIMKLIQSGQIKIPQSASQQDKVPMHPVLGIPDVPIIPEGKYHNSLAKARAAKKAKQNNDSSGSSQTL